MNRLEMQSPPGDGMKTIAGIKFDAAPIGAGLYKLIVARKQEGIVAVGMIPADIVELAGKLIREKVSSLIPADKYTATERAKMIEDADRKICKEVVSAIYRAASDAGKMLV